MYTEIVEYTCMLSIWNKFKKKFLQVWMECRAYITRQTRRGYNWYYNRSIMASCWKKHGSNILS